jgi:GDP-L-fucose synthase
VYGPGDSFDPYKSHLLSALIRRLHDAKTSKAREAVVWGSGNPSREFIFSDDLADACVFLMERGDVNRIGELINVGSGTQITIKELAQTVARVVGYEGRIVFDNDKDDVVPKKHLDSTRIAALGWKKPKTELYEGINLTYADFLSRIEEINKGNRQ